MTQQQIKAMLADESTRTQALDVIGQWAKDTCLLHGTTTDTAYKVAWILVNGVEASYEGRKPDRRVW